MGGGEDFNISVNAKTGLVNVASGGGNNLEIAVVRAYADEGFFTEDTIIVNDAGYNVFKFYHATADNFKAKFSGGDCYLVKPNKDVEQLTNNVAKACGIGECYLIFESACASVTVASNHISGKIKTLYGGKFYCSNNQLTSLSLPNATYVDCYSNQLTSLSLPNATYVSCYSNQLTSLSLPNATYVDCYSNQLTSLSLPNATDVDCYSNQLTSLSLPNATDVNCSNNQLTSLSLPNATDVNCSNNALPASAIASLFASWKVADNEYGEVDFTGGTNAPISHWSAQAVIDKDYLVNTKLWIISYNS